MSRLRDIEIKTSPTDQSDFKITLLKRLKQLLSKLIWPFPKMVKLTLRLEWLEQVTKGQIYQPYLSTPGV